MRIEMRRGSERRGVSLGSSMGAYCLLAGLELGSAPRPPREMRRDVGGSSEPSANGTWSDTSAGRLRVLRMSPRAFAQSRSLGCSSFAARAGAAFRMSSALKVSRRPNAAAARHEETEGKCNQQNNCHEYYAIIRETSPEENQCTA